MHWMDAPIHFIDFEGSLSSGILEYGVVTFKGGAFIQTRTRLCRATGRIRPDDVLVHGLDEDRLASHAPFSDDFDYFVSLRASGPLAAHYAHAENSMLKSVWAYPRVVPHFARPGTVHADWLFMPEDLRRRGIGSRCWRWPRKRPGGAAARVSP